VASHVLLPTTPTTLALRRYDLPFRLYESPIAKGLDLKTQTEGFTLL
jgi:hypothetical protein